MTTKPIVIGVTGGSGSGKTSVSQQILRNFQGYSVMLLAQDNYYKDQAHLAFEQRLQTSILHRGNRHFEKQQAKQKQKIQLYH